MEQTAPRQNGETLMTRRNVLKGTKLNLCHAVLAITVSGCLFPTIAHAQSMEASSTYNIPAGDLASAVDTFSRQSGLQILYKPELLAGKRAELVTGSLRGSDAFNKLLKGSGVTWEKVNETTYVLRDKQKKAQDKSITAPPGKASISASDEEGKVTTLSEILVVGSKSLNVDARRTKDDVQPYVVFNRDEIERSLASNIEEFLGTRLPMNQTRGTSSRNTPEGSGGNRSSFNLRGLGANQTLILVNGRRVPGVATLRTGDLAQPDLNGIPIASVERIEVLPTTASGIYGGGATGGVINVILRKDYVGSEVQVTYDNSFDTDSARRRVDFSTGISLEEGRTHLMLAGSFANGNDLLVRDRDFAMRGRNLLMANDPDAFVRSAVSGQRTNIFSIDGESLVLRDGTSLGSNIASVPVGYAGGDGGAGLIAGAGDLDIEIPNNISGGRQSLSAVPKTSSLNLTIRRDFGSSIDLYLDMGRSRNEGITRFAGFASQQYVSADDPGNPFLSDIYVTFPYSGKDLERSNVSISETAHVNTGIIIKLPGDWSAGADVNWSKSTNTTHMEPSTLDDIDIGRAVRDGELDIFRDLNAYPLDLSPYRAERFSSYGPSDASLTEYSVRAAGPIISLPAGEVQLSAVASNRRERASSARSIYIQEYLGEYAEFSSTEFRFYPSRFQDVTSLYAEIVAPLVGAGQEIPLVRTLEVQGSVRHDRYRTQTVDSPESILLPTEDAPIPPYGHVSTKLQSTDFTVGLRYEPVNGLALRASYGTGFLPPSVAQLSSQQFELDLLFLQDPKRGNEFGPVGPLLYTFGGSIDLDPETSESFSVGAILTPPNMPGLRISADYTRIDKRGEITTLTLDQLLALEDELPGRITRGANLPGDPTGYAGVIEAIDFSLVNIARSQVEAIDFQIEYKKDFGGWGELDIYGVATLQTSLETQVNSVDSPVERVGKSDGPLRWRGNYGLAWKNGGWNVAVNTQWYDGYRVYGAFDDDETREILALRQGSENVRSQFYTDLSARYTVSEGVFNGLQISGGVRNIFGSNPPAIATLDTRGGYSTYGDPRGRTYAISLKMPF